MTITTELEVQFAEFFFFEKCKMQSGIWTNYCFRYILKAAPSSVKKKQFFATVGVGNHYVTLKPFNQTKILF